MEEELKTMLKEAFGDSSSDSDVESTEILQRRLQIRVSVFGDGHSWEPIKEINGLWICRDFLSAEQQSSLLSSLEREGYFAEGSNNQAMRFGDLPPWAIELSYLIREDILLSSNCSESVDLKPVDESKETCIFPPQLLWREPFYNQYIVNIYQPGEGICPHVDLMRFEDGIAVISLESSCVMHFSLATEEVNECVPSAKIPVLLTPGSLIFMWGEARYLWKHEINRKPGFQKWEGLEIEQKRRTSLTLRRLCPME